MKKFYILFFLTQLSIKGFSQVILNDTIYYPNRNLFDSNKLKKISLSENNLNFKEIKLLVDNIHQHDSIPFFEIKDKRLIRKIIPLRYDWGFFKGRNFLTITEDSILIGENYSISNLYDQLREHYLNNNKNPGRSQSAKKAVVKILFDSNKSAEYLGNHIIRITQEFDKLNQEHSDTLSFKLVLDYPNRIPPPPEFIDNLKEGEHKN